MANGSKKYFLFFFLLESQKTSENLIQTLSRVTDLRHRRMTDTALSEDQLKKPILFLLPTATIQETTMDILARAGIIRPLISPERAFTNVLPPFGRQA